MDIPCEPEALEEGIRNECVHAMLFVVIMIFCLEYKIIMHFVNASVFLILL